VAQKMQMLRVDETWPGVSKCNRAADGQADTYPEHTRFPHGWRCVAVMAKKSWRTWAQSPNRPVVGLARLHRGPTGAVITPVRAPFILT
jgi:hypothetical protein